jgi:hypothetical protein
MRKSACVLFFLLLASGPSLAHEDAAWIMQNPAYKDQNGTHCCGPSDCKRERATDFREAPEGIYVTTASGELLMPRSLVGRGLYPSINDDWWICAREGVVKCVFKPTTGG